LRDGAKEFAKLAEVEMMGIVLGAGNARLAADERPR
jgi:hypothetical protein